MARIAVVGSFPESLVIFRGSLIRSMTERGHEVIAVAPKATMQVRAELVRLGADYREIQIQRAGLNPFADLRTYQSLKRLFLDVRPDIALFYTIKPIIYGSLAASSALVPRTFSIITGLGTVFTSTSIIIKFLRILSKALYRRALATNDTVFFQNPDDRNLFRSLGLTKSSQKTVIINGSGVDVGHYTPVPFPESERFLLIARLLREKGLREYVEACQRIREIFPEVECELVGWLDEHPSAIGRSEFEGWIASGAITYAGRLADVRPAIARSSVYVLPSYREGTPRSSLEAMSMGRPIVTTDTPGCRETVIDGVNGLLVPPRDADALVNAMMKFIGNPSLAKEMGKQSRRLAVEKFDVRKVNAQMLDVMGL